MKLYKVKGKAIMQTWMVDSVVLANNKKEAGQRALDLFGGESWQKKPAVEQVNGLFEFVHDFMDGSPPQLDSKGWLTNGYVALHQSLCAMKPDEESNEFFKDKKPVIVHLDLHTAAYSSEPLVPGEFIKEDTGYYCIQYGNAYFGAEWALQFQRLGIGIHRFEGKGNRDPHALVKDGQLVGIIMPRDPEKVGK